MSHDDDPPSPTDAAPEVNGVPPVPSIAPKPSEDNQTPASFDYSAVSAPVARTLAEIAGRIRTLVKGAVFDIGNELRKVKAALEHGQFEAWVVTELEMSVRTAENYMCASEWAEGKNEIIALLPPTAIYRLAARSTPEKARDQVAARVLESGKPLSAKAVAAIISDVRTEEKKAQAAELAEKELQEQQAREAMVTAEDRKRQEELAQRRNKREEAKQRKSERELREGLSAYKEAIAIIVSRLGDDLQNVVDLLKVAERNHGPTVNLACDLGREALIQHNARTTPAPRSENGHSTDAAKDTETATGARDHAQEAASSPDFGENGNSHEFPTETDPNFSVPMNRCAGTHPDSVNAGP